MADITMCSPSKKCEKQDTCYRTIAKKSMFQSFSDFSVTCTKENNYDMFLDARDYGVDTSKKKK